LAFAGEHLSDAYYGFMEGGAQTGRLAAALALEKIAMLV
jgi:monoamine oxidase